MHILPEDCPNLAQGLPEDCFILWATTNATQCVQKNIEKHKILSFVYRAFLFRVALLASPVMVRACFYHEAVRNHRANTFTIGWVILTV